MRKEATFISTGKSTGNKRRDANRILGSILEANLRKIIFEDEEK